MSIPFNAGLLRKEAKQAEIESRVNALLNLKTLARVEGLADEAAKPHRASLQAQVLCSIELGAVAQWLSDQDESIDPARITAIARQAVINIHRKYAS
jgi:hypothetical protein